MTTGSRPAGRSRLREMVSGRLIIAVVALVLAVVFVVQNTQRVRIHFVFFTVSSRLWIGFIVCLVLGALLGQVLGLLRRRRS
jgi:lipopolysaccharide assembly protein A